MDEKENESKINKEKKADASPESDTKTYFWVGAGAAVAGVIAFVLTLCLPKILGVYGLIAAVLCALVSLSFLGTQKKKNNFKAVLYVTIASYILLAVYVAFFIGGIIYASSGTNG